MSLFSTHESVSLEKGGPVCASVTAEEVLDEVYEIDRIIEWVEANEFKKLCLQFPDAILVDAAQVALKLQQRLGKTVYILGDTAYESCCVDYLSAKHIEGDAVVHFGTRCFSSPTHEIPCLYVYEKKSIDLDAFAKSVNEAFADEKHVDVVLDTTCCHLKDSIKRTLENAAGLRFYTIDEFQTEVENLCRRTILFVSDDTKKITNFNFKFKPERLLVYDAARTSVVDFNLSPAVLKRRRYLAEKIKDSRTVGIVIGTLAVKNYLSVIERLKALLKVHRKKHYLISVGKPNVPKLANFPEIDVFVLIACANNEIYDDRDFYQPIVTVYDVETALNPTENQPVFSYDFNAYNYGEIQAAGDAADVSLLSGKVRGVPDGLEQTVGQELLKKSNVLALGDSNGAHFLASRSWRGLEQDLGRTEVELAHEGRRGIARGYSNETV